MGGTFTCLNFHIIFSTKERSPLIIPELCADLYNYVGGTIRGEGGISDFIGGTSDHLHLLLRWKPDYALSELVQKIKSHSSGCVNKTSREKHFYWQEGYGAFSVSQSHMTRVRQYIAHQARHHRKKDFKDELRGFLKAHGIPYDEDYIWL